MAWWSHFQIKVLWCWGELLSQLKNYLQNQEQRVTLNGQTSGQRNINSGVPQGSVLGQRLFLIYINDLPDGITSKCKIFADDTSLFQKDLHKSVDKLNIGLQKINEWANQWIMHFNPDPKKKENGVTFSRKLSFK